jgi:tetratricopeptide (TPR) repeat protein
VARKHRRDPGPGDLEFIPLTDPERRRHADALLHRADHDPAERAQLLTEAAELYAMLGEHPQAEHLFNRALDDGGTVAGSVHGYYAAFLFDQGREAEALDLINQARKLRPVDPDVFNVIGETLLEREHPADAAKWFTTGLVRTLGDLADIELDDLYDDPDAAMLIRGRHQARRALAQPPDHLDELLQRYLADKEAR